MILFENVTKKYRGTAKPALDGIDLKVDRGEFVFIVGASGSGKSSCLRLILREDQPSVGSIHVLGQDLSKISSRKVPYFRRSLGTVFQDFRLLQNKTVYDNVAFTLQVIGKSRGFIQEAVPDTLEMVGLANKAKRFPHELSGGEQQRVAIARAIVNKPAILLADEPTGNLDPATSLGIMQLLRAINAAGTTVVMATHEATFVDIMQQRVVELSQGVVVRDEQGGGYGETASIPIADLSEAGAQVLRTSEAVVRAALQPDGTPVASQGGAAQQPVAQPTQTPPVQQTQSAAIPMAEALAAQEAARQRAAQQAAAESAEPLAPPIQPAQPVAASVFEEPNPFGDNEEDLDETRRAEDPTGRRIPAFLEPGKPLDPLQMSETGSLAEHLGLNRKDNDDETDVGPVR
ncbi:cell division ATP-binding protein FtsE [Leucobacter insecticola]|uniref:Cell division ATP-binding protein FtsE n=1 Tax=Leucobacter insecticola TaxID=2714934 RepID=A0A6G8FLK2_9MICO|nr:cell division ATP-binding protein FtsE [Leucobacter insecticola]QIM16962.1 cell division ATP-binding protein FtsE [Leucobacter insecticola]